MKTLKSHSIKSLFTLVMVVILSTACGQTSKSSTDKTTASVPEIDLQTAVITGNLEINKRFFLIPYFLQFYKIMNVLYFVF